MGILTFSLFSCVENGVTYDASDWEGMWNIKEDCYLKDYIKNIL